ALCEGHRAKSRSDLVPPMPAGGLAGSGRSPETHDGGVDMINRRTFSKAVGLGTGAAAVSLSGLQTSASAATASHEPGGAPVPTVPLTSGTHTEFRTIKQVKAGLLDIGYAEAGPAHGPVVICLHGWPYDIHSFVDVAPLLADLGYRVIVPYLRGHGSTRFLS